jgi:hypothetical protein
LDRGFSGGRAQNWASIVLCPTNSTQNSAIYKLTSGPAGWLAQHCTSIVLCPPNNARSSAIYKLTDGLQGWRGRDCHCLRMVIPINYLTVSENIISNTKLALTSDNWTYWYETVGITSSAIYKLTTGFRHRPLFRVTDYAFKCSERYNLNVGASRLLERPCQPVLDPPVVGFTKCPILGNCFGLLAFELCWFLFRNIHLALEISALYNSTVHSTLFPFSSSRVLSPSGYILCRLSMIAGSSVVGLTYLHFHLYPHMTNPIDRCSFPYLRNFPLFTDGNPYQLSNSI